MVATLPARARRNRQRRDRVGRGVDANPWDPNLSAVPGGTRVPDRLLRQPQPYPFMLSDYDNMNSMREVTASEASRNFSMLLSSVDRGETVVVTRAGRRIATIAPASPSNGAAFNEVIDKWRKSESLGEAFNDQMAAARAAATASEDSDPWSD